MSGWFSRSARPGLSGLWLLRCIARQIVEGIYLFTILADFEMNVRTARMNGAADLSNWRAPVNDITGRQ